MENYLNILQAAAAAKGEPGLLYRAPEENDCHDYDPSWEYEVDESPDKALARMATSVARGIYKNTKQPFELWACKLDPNTVAVYVDGTGGYPVILIDLEKHRDYQDQIGKTIYHELKHAEQDQNQCGYDEDEAEDV